MTTHRLPLIAIVSASLIGHWAWLWPIAAMSGLLSVIGLIDLTQRQHAVRRNYPILGHIRYLIEDIRPEIASTCWKPTTQLPFSRSQRSLVYARAKNEGGEKAFGTLGDVYRDGYEFIGHSIRAGPSPTRKPSASTSADRSARSPTRPPSSTSRR